MEITFRANNALWPLLKLLTSSGGVFFFADVMGKCARFGGAGGGKSAECCVNFFCRGGALMIYYGGCVNVGKDVCSASGEVLVGGKFSTKQCS